jgi:hypothetical protein
MRVSTFGVAFVENEGKQSAFDLSFKPIGFAFLAVEQAWTITKRCGAQFFLSGFALRADELGVYRQEPRVDDTRDRGDSCHRFPIGMSKRARDHIDSLLVSVAMALLTRSCAAFTHASLARTSQAFEDKSFL